MDNPLTPDHFRRMDETPDRLFYAPPRLVKHIDEPACAALAAFYGEYLPTGGRVLDLMSSCVSHLPDDIPDDILYDRVIGHGMNAMELAANPQLTGGFVKDLNADPTLPLADNAFDACIVAVSIQYLTRAPEVFADVARVLRPGAPFILSWSNRCFPTKAVAIWQALSDQQKSGLIDLYFELAGGFGERQFFNLSPSPDQTDPLYAMMARRNNGQANSFSGS